MQEHFPGTRLFYCDPPGHTGINNLFNHGRDDAEENNYIFFHDQEPVHTDIFGPLFDEVIRRNADLINKKDPSLPGLTKYPYTWDIPVSLPKLGSIITSEFNSEFVEQLCEKYGWKHYYYFYHGWAALDWYRGYDRTFLIKRASDRSPTKTFMSPNRIVGGHRDHRILFLYEIFKRNLQHNYISAPRTCPVEKTDITHIALKYGQEVVNVLNQANLPQLFPNEETQLMTSCWLDNFELAADSMFYVPTETVYWGRRNHLTEKTFKAIALEMPFILVAPAHSLEYLRNYGFKTFSDVIDESYDTEVNDFKRIERVGQLLQDLDNLSVNEKSQIWKHCSKIATYNYKHFYSGEFEHILWKELKLMLTQLENDYV